eukprot:15451548-Alexandrium_andersonii.AAC.1
MRKQARSAALVVATLARSACKETGEGKSRGDNDREEEGKARTTSPSELRVGACSDGVGADRDRRGTDGKHLVPVPDASGTLPAHLVKEREPRQGKPCRPCRAHPGLPSVRLAVWQEVLALAVAVVRVAHIRGWALAQVLDSALGALRRD